MGSIPLRNYGTGSSSTDISFEQLSDHWKWILAYGIGLFIMGLVAVTVPLATTMLVQTLVGGLFGLAGLMTLFQAFKVKKLNNILWQLFLTLLYLSASAFMFFYPFEGLLTLTIFLAAFFLVQGTLRTLLALDLRGESGWGWIFFSGLTAIALGLLIFFGLPEAAYWVTGLVVGIDLMLTGLSFSMLALAVHRAAQMGTLLH